MALDGEFDFQARACRHMGSPLYGELGAAVAAALRAGDPPLTAIMADHADATHADAIPLRLLGAVHALVLSGAAPELAPFYGSDRVDPAPAWPIFRTTLIEHADHVRDWLTRPPQTNDVGRSVPLLSGLLSAVAWAPLPVRLFELGSSAGLNLRADHFRWEGDGIAWGPVDSPVRITDAWRKPLPAWLIGAAAKFPQVEVVERHGCDPDPLDPLDPAAALALRAYVWPEHHDRRARLDGALDLAPQVPAEITRTGAGEFLSGLRLVPGTLTVVWHSVMRQYVPEPEWAVVVAELDRLAAASSADAAFAHIAFEPAGDYRFVLTVRHGDGPPTELARALPHGVPTFV
ncbi:DUF2332 domain-containing protein [Nocardia stercoris]|uniref:DUF2332 domain-containing protein n=1 Tax=Nocardia stercoris TaxID=2483361 RepID=A0A3M2LEF0_9NOCA|nr:DUF2332 domain-containing protein [Nocardia stercoris]RMI35842.1 DUF2332 domain-containing protein [Nocardia stercoris]